MSQTVVLGAGVTGRAVARGLLKHDTEVCLVDDRPDAVIQSAFDDLSLELIVSPTLSDWKYLLLRCDRLVVSPGIPDGHPALTLSGKLDVPILDESDLARDWDDRPRCAVTGTNGKTSVVTLVTEMLLHSGVRAMAAGNNEVPLVAAIEDSEVEVFVVEASSFRLGHAATVELGPAAWLNFSPDHLDIHRDLAAYESAKSRIWEALEDPEDAVANMADPVVKFHAPQGATGYGSDTSACRIEGDHIVYREGRVVSVNDLPRVLPHDLSNAQAAVSLALRSGANIDACATALRRFTGLPHRMEIVEEINGVQFVNDSKATTPHAVLSALSGLSGAVLIAGGRNKGLDLSVLRSAIQCLTAVVAIGEAAEEVMTVFAGSCPLERADSMQSAVELAWDKAASGGTVLLSPGCASFDWYTSYIERGIAFTQAVKELRGSG